MGGAENYCLRLIAYAAIDRFDWHVTSGNLRNAVMESLYRDAGVTTHHMSPGYANPKLIWQFRRFLDAKDFDIIMSFNGIFGGLSLLLAKQRGIPVRVGWHRRSTPAYSATSGRRLYSAMSLRMLERSATHILSNSRTALDQFHGSKWRDNDRYRVIPNGVDADRFRPCAGLGHAVRGEFSIPLSSFVIGHIGRFDPAKDHETLLATVRAVRDRGLDARLLVAGTGTDSASFSARLRHYKLEDVASCLGPRQDVERLYQAMDIFLFPSVTEGQPNALIEAMLSGIRIMASDIGPIRETVPEFLHNSLFRAGDSSGAADLLLTTINDSSDDVKRARAWATDYYNPSRNFDAVLEVLGA